MNAPSPNLDAEMLTLASTSPSARRAPLTSLGRWRWLGYEREREKKSATMQDHARRRGRGFRARTVLIWGLLFYALLQPIPLLLLLRSTEFPWHAVGTAIEARKWPRLRQLVAEHPDRPLLLMLGSSRVCWALRAGVLDGMPDSDGRPLRVYNLGVPSTGPIYELLYLRDLLAEGIRPRFLLLEFNPTLLCAPHGAVNEEDLMGVECISARRLLRWLPYFRHPARRAGDWLVARLAPWYTFRHAIQLEVKCLTEGKPCPTYEAVDDWGWHIPLTTQWPADERSSRLALEYFGYYSQLRHFRWCNKPTQALRELLDLCRREQIPAALVVMPESSRFRRWYSNEAKTAIHGLLEDLSQTYGVEVIDANCWLADDDFEDGHHAVLHGANVFTDRLGKELPRLLAQAKPAKPD